MVTIGTFDVKMELKNNGVELKVSSAKNKHLGDLIVNTTRLEWCTGRTRRGNGKKIRWAAFIKYMEAQQKPAARRKRAPAKKTKRQK